jgi:uncharacterized protein YegL
VDPKAKISPVYFVPDESWSMDPVTAELNAGLKHLLDAIHGKPYAAAMIRFSIVGFSDNAMEHVRLADLRDLTNLPQLKAYSGTSYANIFRDLRTRLEADVRTLREDGNLVTRPIVFFLSDGEPNTEDWQSPLEALKSETFKWRPHILAFGIGDARAAVIREVASFPKWAFIAAQGSDAGVALTNFLDQLTRTVMSTAQSLAAGVAELPVEPPEGFISLDILPDE